MSHGKFISNGKQVVIGGRDFTTDESLTMTDENVLGVTMPFRTMTQEEFDSASEDEKKGVILTNPQIGIPIAHPEIYSEEETLIGSWFGEPLYRKVYNVRTPSSHASTTVISLPSNFYVVNIYGFVKDFGSTSMLPYNSSTGVGMELAIHGNEVKMAINSNFSYLNSPTVLIIEYTKTTDE